MKHTLQVLKLPNVQTKREVIVTWVCQLEWLLGQICIVKAQVLVKPGSQGPDHSSFVPAKLAHNLFAGTIQGATTDL